MRRAAIAGRILACVTTPDRAAALVGDLLEEEPSRGRRWFWVAVARTLAAFTWLNLVRVLSGRHSASSGADMLGPIMDVWRFVWMRKWLLVMPVVLFAAAATMVSYVMLVRYRAETRVVVIPPLLPESLARSTVTLPIDGRLPVISQQVLSRNRLQRIIDEFGLYEEQAGTEPMHDVIERMRKDVAIDIDPSRGAGDAATFTVSFTSPDPRSAMLVADRLASMFIQWSVENRQLQARSTDQFLTSQIDALANEVDLLAARMERHQAERRTPPPSLVLEYEEVQNAYRALVAKGEESRLALALEQRQIGGRFGILHAAELPTRPEGPDRLGVILFGAGTGLAVGVLLMLASSRRRSIPPPPAVAIHAT